MSKNIAKRLISGVLALASLTACVTTATACETDYPKVQLTLSFNGEEYKLDYELSRKLAPRTVEHFLWLADKGFYDGLCVHNYEEGADKMYTGGYTYTDAEGDEDGLVDVNYYNKVKELEEKYGEKLPYSVWNEWSEESGMLNPTYTLSGEFEDNDFIVESGDLRQTYGSLTMYYTEKDVEDKIFIKYLGGENAGKPARRDYKYNSATSLFYISLANSSTSSDEYCTFAKLEERSEDNLDKFIEDLEAYIEENYASEEETDETFTTERKVSVNDNVTGKSTETYYVPNEPIIIKKITVKKF